MKNDWHLTQNSDYFNLLKQRLVEEKLIWVKQFVTLINSNNIKNNIKINDIGCNVGHFARAVNDINSKVDYCGYDISDVYINFAKDFFKQDFFYNLDISKDTPRNCNVTIISATLEHIINYKIALKNIAISTSDLIILRTFIGDEYSCDSCLKPEAAIPYTIQQFTQDDIISAFDNAIWDYELLTDEATNSVIKYVCNSNSIPRKQIIFLFKKKPCNY